MYIAVTKARTSSIGKEGTGDNLQFELAINELFDSFLTVIVCQMTFGHYKGHLYELVQLIMTFDPQILLSLCCRTLFNIITDYRQVA